MQRVHKDFVAEHTMLLNEYEALNTAQDSETIQVLGNLLEDMGH